MKPRDPIADWLLFEDDYFNELFAAAPTFGVMSGYHQYDAEVEDMSEAAVAKRITALKAQATRLAAIPKDRLEPAQQIDYDFLAARIDGELHDTDVIRAWRTNPMGYVSMPGSVVDVVMKRNFAPASERVRSVVARLHGIPLMVAAMKANVQNPAPELTDLAARLAAGSVGYFRHDVAIWGRAAAKDDAVLLGQFESANEAAAKALEDAAAWLKNDLMKRSKGGYAIGADAYLKKLKFDEMVDLPLDQVLAIGERNLEKDYQAFVETARLIDPKKTPAEVMATSGAAHPAADDLLPAVRRTADGIRQYLIDHDIVTVPSQVRATVVETPPFMRSGTYAAMDTPGAYETKATEAYYYVTPVEKEWPAAQQEEHLRLFNKYTIDIVTVHEAYPGHYVQFLYAPKFPTKTRKLLFAYSAAEGWAHYTEQMMIEQGFGGADPRYKLSQLSEALLRDCRYVAGIKLHTQGWTIDQATELFITKGFQERAVAKEEARRGAFDPLYLAYTLGKLQMLKLRADYQAKLGPAYTLKKFHDAYLRQGSLPITLIRRAMLGPDSGPSL